MYSLNTFTKSFWVKSVSLFISDFTIPVWYLHKVHLQRWVNIMNHVRMRAGWETIVRMSHVFVSTPQMPNKIHLNGLGKTWAYPNAQTGTCPPLSHVSEVEQHMHLWWLPLNLCWNRQASLPLHSDSATSQYIVPHSKPYQVARALLSFSLSNWTTSASILLATNSKQPTPDNNQDS